MFILSSHSHPMRVTIITFTHILYMSEEFKKPSKRELVDMLVEMNKNIENLPQHAMIGFITNYDLSALLILLEAIFRADLPD